MKKKNYAGFSIVELLVVIAVFAVLAAIAVPNFLQYMPKSRLNGATRIIASDLMAARMEAVKLNQTVYMQQTGGNDHEYKIIKSADILKTVDLHNDYEDVAIDDFGKVVFNSRGIANSSHTVTVTNPSGSKTIDVNIAGRVKIN